MIDRGRDAPKFLKDTPVTECVGLGGFVMTISQMLFLLDCAFSLMNSTLFPAGIVRNIDPVNKLFFILTPVPRPDLQRLNTLLKGNLEVPASMFLQASEFDSFM